MMLNMDMPVRLGPQPALVVPTVFAFVSWDGSGHRRACPLATFDCPRDSSISLTARLMCVDPPRADSAEIANARDVAGSIALVVRGGCSFADKARRVQAAGAIAMVLANNTREEPDAAFTMAEDEVQPGVAPPFPPAPAITIPCVMMCLLDVRELFQKFPPTAQSGVLTLEVLRHDEAVEVAAESLRLRQEMKVKYEEQQRRGGGGGGGWGVGSALRRKTTALMKLLETQPVDSQQVNGSLSTPGDLVASATAPTTKTHGPGARVGAYYPVATPAEQMPTDARIAVSEVSSTTVLPAAKPTPLVAFVQWAISADAYQLEFAPLADFCRLDDGAVFDGPLVVCDPVLANTDRIANAAELHGSVALVKRGACTFPAKLERVQACGAVAAIVGNDDESDPNAAFVMSVDSIKTDHIAIVAVMVSHVTFQRLVADKPARIRILCVAAGPATADLLARSGSISPIDEAYQEVPGGESFGDGEEDVLTAEVMERSDVQELDDEFNCGVGAFHAACRAGDHESCLRLISNICGDNEDQVRKLISKRDSNWRRALHHACAGGNERIVWLLLEWDASPFDVDLAAQTALHVASAHAHTKCVELLRQAAGSSNDEDGRLMLLNPDIGGSTPIHLATISGSTDTLELLLTASAQVAEDGTCKFDGVNERNADGATPLHLACRYERVDCAVYLLAANADVNAIDSSGYTPLAIACEMVNEGVDGNASDSLYIIEKLIAAGAIMDEASMLGTTESVTFTSKSSGAEISSNTTTNGRLLLDRIDSPMVKREVEALYLRHEAQTLRSTLRAVQQEKSELTDRVDSLGRSIAQLQRQDKAALTATEQQNAKFKCQIDQLQCQMSSLLQLLRVNSDASRLIGGNCSDLSLVAAVSDRLFESSPGKLFTDTQTDSERSESSAVTGRVRSDDLNEALKHQHAEASPKADAASQQELALDAGLARDLGKKLLRRQQFYLAEAYFARSLEILPLPGVAQLRNKAQAAQQERRAASHSKGTTATVAQSSEASDPLRPVQKEVLSPATKEATIQRLITAVIASGASEHVRASLEREVNKLKMISCNSNEFELACKWLQWLTTLPWGDPETGLASAASEWEPWAHTGSSLDMFLELERLERDHECQDEDLAARRIQRMVREWRTRHPSAASCEDVVAAIKIQRAIRCWRLKRIALVNREQAEGSVGNENVDGSAMRLHNNQKPPSLGLTEECVDDTVDYSVDVDQAVLRKLPKPRRISLVTGTRLCGNGDHDCHQYFRILQLLRAQIKVPRHVGGTATTTIYQEGGSTLLNAPGCPLAEESIQFYVWTRWCRGQGGDTYSQGVLSGPYEDQNTASRRYERILADESVNLRSQAMAGAPGCIKTADHALSASSTVPIPAHPVQRFFATSA